jgi:hypothetical protein
LPDHQSELACALNTLAVLIRDRSNRDRSELLQAHNLLNEAIRHQLAALKINPKNPKYLTAMCLHCQNQADILVRAGEHEKAAAVIVELPRAFRDGWRVSYLAAGLLSRCVPLAEKDGGLPEAKRKELARKYGRQAVEVLRTAVQQGFKRYPSLEADPAFAPLRPRADFQELLRELRERGAAPARP